VAYLDEAEHVHVHLVPRREGEEMGFSLLARPHTYLTDLSMVPVLYTRMRWKGGVYKSSLNNP